MNKVINITFASSITDICEVNSSFSAGVLKIAYCGENRNKTHISKEVFERCMQTIYNCPIVCNYNRDDNTFGGHDMEVVRDKNNNLSVINVTAPVGCVPESAKVWFEQIEEDDGTIHEYLFADALLWKRQEAFKKIYEDGIVAQSMEITIKDGETIDGIFYIYDFEFTAFALIGVEPCFESASLELYSNNDFKSQIAQMMQDLKENSNSIIPSKDVNDIHPQKYSTEGGSKVLEEKIELAAKYGIDINELNYSIEDYSIEELTEKFEEAKSEKFNLTNNILNEIRLGLESETYEDAFGEWFKYMYVDSDLEAKEVYCLDSEDWFLYGFSFAIDGDKVTIDFDSKKRKKWAIVDFKDEKDANEPFASQISETFNELKNRLSEYSQFEEKYNDASETINTMQSQIDELSRFKAETEEAYVQNQKDEVFESFTDLYGIEAFEELRNNCKQYDVETLEDKCYAIRGRMAASAKFAIKHEKVPKIKIEKTDLSKEPYGDLFTKYSKGLNN